MKHEMMGNNGQTNPNASMLARCGRMAARGGAVVVLALYAGAVLASGGAVDINDPMGSGMCYFVRLLTGKWAFGISVIGLFATAASFLAGVEMNEFIKKIAGVFMVACALLGGSAIMRAVANFFGAGIC